MRKYILLMIAAIAISSCSDFLEESSQNLSYVNNVEDLSELLAGEAYMQRQGVTSPGKPYTWTYSLDDDVREHQKGVPWSVSTVTTAAPALDHHRWQQYPYNEDKGLSASDNSGSDQLLDDLYEKISATNLVISEVERFKSSGSEYNRVKGEALALRAMYYFQLVNYWGLPYDAKTANTDLGVPLKTSPEVVNDGFARSSVADCYAQIVSDAKEAEKLLEGIEQAHKCRIDQKTTRLFLSRVYLFMGDWQNAYDMADAVLAAPGAAHLYDMNNATSATTYSKECITNAYDWCETLLINGAMYKACKNESGSNFVTSDELYAQYDNNDLRKSMYYAKTTYMSVPFYMPITVGKDLTSPITIFSFFIQEAYLNKAEAAAMLSNTDAAISTITDLRATRLEDRIETEDFSAMSEEELVNFIRAERRRELAFRGHRWFDLRRYAVSPKYPVKTTIRHEQYVWNKTTKSSDYLGYYQLNEYPGDNGWLIPFPTTFVRLNEGKLIDNVRPERPMITDNQ